MSNPFRMMILACSLLVCGAVVEGQMPGPTDVQATAGDGQIAVKFPGIYGVNSYNVYYSKTSGVPLTSRVQVTNSRGCYSLPCDTVTFLLNSLNNGTPYYIVATFMAGSPSSESLPSNEVYAIPTIPTYAYTLNFNSGNISAFTLDQTTGALKKLFGQPFGTVGSPNSLAIAGDRFAYVVSPLGNRLMAYKYSRGNLTPLPGYPSLNAEGSSWITTDPKGNYIYTANSGSAQVSAYRVTASGNPDHIADYYSGNNPQFVAVDPKGRFLYVANYADGTIAAYKRDTATGALTVVPNGKNQAFKAGNNPISIAINPSGTLLYVANNSVDNNGNNLSAYTIDQTSGALNGPTSYSAGNSPQCVAVDPSGRFVYVTNYLSNNISAYKIVNSTDELTPVVNSPFTAGVNPYYIAFSPNGRYLSTTNSGENTISRFKIDLLSGSLSNNTKYSADSGVGKTPFQMVVVGNAVPNPPTMLYFTKSDSIRFSSVANATSYIAYIDTSTSVSPQNYQIKVVGIRPAGKYIPNLTPRINYYVVISAVNEYGEGPPSFIVLRH